MNEKRDDFSAQVKNISKLKAAYICSNPACRKSTIAPSLTDEMLIQYSGEVAHITAAAPKGPRYDNTVTPKERQSISNAIFLCCNCAELIDKNNGVDYPVELLRSWKVQHDTWVIENLNKGQFAEYMAAVASNNQIGGITAHTVNINTTSETMVNSRLIHDKDIFTRSCEIFDEESMVRMCEDLLNDGRCKVDDTFNFQHLNEFFKKAGNSFLDPVVDSTKSNFIKTIQPLDSYIHSHFDKWPYNQEDHNFTIQLMPQYLRDTAYRNMELGDRDKWDKLFKRLKKLTTESLVAYQSFRLAVKNAYHI